MLIKIYSHYKSGPYLKQSVMVIEVHHVFYGLILMREGKTLHEVQPQGGALMDWELRVCEAEMDYLFQEFVA